MNRYIKFLKIIFIDKIINLQVDCLSYDQYEKVKDRQLKEKQMEKEAKPLPGKNSLKN